MKGQGEFEVKFREIGIVHYLLKNKMKSPVALNTSITQILVYDTIYPIKGTRADSISSNVLLTFKAFFCYTERYSCALQSRRMDSVWANWMGTGGYQISRKIHIHNYHTCHRYSQSSTSECPGDRCYI